MPRDCGRCSLNLFDHTAIYVNPYDYAWELVAGGGGSLHDPVDGPTTGLRSVWSTAGGAGGATVSTVGNGQPAHLTVMLDTGTGSSSDRSFPTWGTISNLRVTPFIGGAAQPALSLVWTKSPLEPTTTSLFVDANGADIGLATNSFGAPPTATQNQTIWGAGAVLPGRDSLGRAYTSYQLTFAYDVHSHDTRVTQPHASLGGGGGEVSLALVMAAALVVRRRAKAETT